MRILNVKANMHPVWGGGTAERAKQMSLALATKPGIEMTLLTLDLGLCARWRQEMAGVEVVTLTCLNRRFQIPVSLPGVIRRQVERSDVVHLMSHWTLLNALVYRQIRRLGTPYVVCPAGTLEIFGRSKLFKNLYSLLAGRRMILDAARQVAITADEDAQLQAYGAPPGSVAVVPNGIRPADYTVRDDQAFRQRYDLGKEPFLLFVGRLNPIKGPDLLVEAFGRLKDRFPTYRLVLAGPDEGMGPELLDLADRLGVAERVRLIGFVAGADKSMAYHAADLLVIPSRQEAMSIVVLESGACGTPVVATDRCGLSEIAEAGGGLVVPATVVGLEQGIATALSDPGGLRKMGDRLKAFTLERFSWDAIGDRLAELFKSVLGESRRRA